MWRGQAITAAIMRNDQILMRVTAQCVSSNPRTGFDMSGRRPLIKGYFATFALNHGCGHVFGLFDADHDAPRGADVVRSSLARITLSRLTAQSMPRALRSNRFIRITSWSPSILLQPRLQTMSAVVMPELRFRCSIAFKLMRTCPSWLASCSRPKLKNMRSCRRKSLKSTPRSWPGTRPMNATDVSPRFPASVRWARRC